MHSSPGMPHWQLIPPLQESPAQQSVSMLQTISVPAQLGPDPPWPPWPPVPPMQGWCLLVLETHFLFWQLCIEQHFSSLVHELPATPQHLSVEGVEAESPWHS